MAITYTLTNDDGGRFSIDGGVVKVAASLAGSAGARIIGVRGTDANGWYLDKNISITVTSAAALFLPFSTWTAAQVAAAGVTATRTGLAWQFDATGKLTSGPNNLLLNTASLSTQTVAISAGNYVLSLTGTGSVALSGGASGTLNGTGVSDRVNLAFTATGSTTFTVSGSVTAARLSRVTYETTMRTVDDLDTTGSAYYGPRLDYDPVTLAAKGLLVEEARTNLCLQSAAFNETIWSKSVGTVTANAVAGPDGTTSADLFIPDATPSGNHQVNQLITLTAASYTMSVYAKSAGYNFVLLQTSVAAGYVEFNLSTGTFVVSGANYTGAIKDVGGGWYRCSATFTGTASSIGHRIFSFPASGAASYTGNGTSGVYLWGAQVELGSSVRSYAPTTASAVTRTAEVVKFTPDAAVSNIRYTFDDGTTQDVAVTGGVEYTIPTSLNRPWIKTIEDV